jgi:hypothetical protein
VPGQCDAFATALLGTGEDVLLDGGVFGHAETCIACQAALARHRRMVRTLGELRSECVPVPPSLLSDVLDAVGRAATRSAARATLSRHRIGSALGLTTAAALIATVVVIERFRSPLKRRTGRGLPTS